MYIRYLITEFNLISAIVDGLMIGANMFDQNSTSGGKQEFRTVVPKEQILDHTKISQDKIHAPFAFHMKSIPMTPFYPETLETGSENINHLAGYIIGDFDTVELPVWKCDNDTIIGDVLSCMLVSALNGNLQLATAYLRSSQLLMSINRTTPLSYIDSDDLQKVREVSLNRL
jgi:hypothetical protein